MSAESKSLPLKNSQPNLLAYEALLSEELKRANARKSLASFIEYLGLSIVPAAHHRLLIEHLEAVERGEINKLMVWMPPGSAKSTYTSVLFPPWFMGRNSTLPVLGVSNTTELAERFSRRARNLTASPLYRNVFGFGCSEDTKAAGSWENERGGEFFAAGIGSAIAGRRAKLGLIDDPIKSREEADSDRIRQKHWDWYLNDFLTRLMPGAAQIFIQCMTGDTRVMLDSGTEKALKDIRVGDAVASYEHGRLVSSKVLNWVNQGTDCVYAIKTKSGRILKANERHPFLVERNGVPGWTRLRSLQIGDKMLCAGERGEGSLALNAISQREPKAIAIPTTKKPSGRAGIGLRRSILNLIARRIFDTDMVLTWITIMRSWRNRMVDVLSAISSLGQMSVRTGAGSCASITTISRTRFVDCSATTVISQWDMEKLRRSYSLPLSTFGVIPDEIVSISPAGTEDVFDIQVERTENFIANGAISHNTRWHQDDLSGRILERESDQWKVIKLPMEAREHDALGRSYGDRLWPEWFTQEMCETAKKDVRAWNALYQQDPAPEDGEYFKREYFNDYDIQPAGVHIYGASDYAVSEGQGDYTEHGIFGLDFTGNLYILDWWREQAASNVWIERQCDLIAQYSPLIWFGEAGPIRKAIEPFLKRRMQERGTLCRLEWLPSIHDKVVRARPFQARSAMGNVFLPAHAPWKPDLMSQLMRFPAGKYDDGVDVCSLIGRGLEHARPPVAPKKVVENPRPSVFSGSAQGWMGQ